MHWASEVSIVARPGYFGKRRREFETNYDNLYGSGKWSECWQVGDLILDFSEAVMLYDDAYHHFLSYNYRATEMLEWLTGYAECYDSYTSNIRCGINHDPTSLPRHIQDVSVRRALIRLGTYFKKYRGPREELYDKDELLHIRSKDSNGYVLSPGNVHFHKPDLIREGHRLPAWCKAGSVEAFWQSNKVIVVQNEDNRGSSGVAETETAC